MNDEGPTRRRFQFGLRKLLLWTAVAALYLGGLKTLGVNDRSTAIIAGWVAVVGSVRGSLGPKAAVITSFVISTLSGVVISLVMYSLGAPRVPLAFLPFLMLLDVWIVWAFGAFIFGLVEFTVRAVNWIDKLMEGKGLDERKD